jgi:hypothetical protein
MLTLLAFSGRRLRDARSIFILILFKGEFALLRHALLSALVAGSLAGASPLYASIPSASSASGAASSAPAVTGTITDATGAIIPGAEVDVKDASGATVATTTTDASGAFQVRPPKQGDYTLSVSIAGFQPASQPIHVGATAAAPLLVKMQVAAAVTQVTVNAASDIDLATSTSNGDTSVMTSSDLKQLPVFDNDYVTAMGSFLDSGDTSTAGTGLMVDGVESNRATVSPSAVQEVHINEDPYSAAYYRPGRGQIEIITKPTSDKLHGQLNFLFRDSALNAQNDFAPNKPFEQRRIYEGNVTGPVPHLPKTGFLFSFNRAEEDLDAVVNATIPTNAPADLCPGNAAAPGSGVCNLNVPAPTRDTEFSLRLGHQFSDRNAAYVTYAFQDSTNRSEGVGNQTLPGAGYNAEYREDDLIFHDDYILSADKLNQASLVLEHYSNPMSDVVEAPQIQVKGNFTGGSAQNNHNSTEYNARLSDIVSWTKGRHNLKFGVNVPHFSRRVLDDETNTAGKYVYSSLADYANANPSGFSISQGQTRFVYAQQEAGAFIQDQIKLNARMSVTPGVRYDWQNYLATDRNNFSPRLSFAYVLDQKSKTVLRGGGGIYYDRIGGGPLVDLARYQTAKRRVLQVSSRQQPLCYPITACADPRALPPSLAENAPGIQTPYQIHYGVLIERQLGEKATISIGGRMNRGNHLFRSIDINAPTPASDYTQRPNPNVSQLRQIQSSGVQKGSALDINYRGRLNRWFTGFAWYSWSHYANDTSGIGYFPENQADANADWGPADWDKRNRFGIFAVVNADHPLNIGFGVFANSGTPYTVLTGTDDFGDNLFNTRPEDVPRNSERGPDYADLDLRWGYDFKLNPKEKDDSPTLGVSASAFDLLNHPNGSSVDNIEGSPDFGEVTSAYPPRRLQLGMRFNF